MTFFSHIGVWVMAPFIAFSLWFGGGAHHIQPSPGPVRIPPIATSTPPARPNPSPTPVPAQSVVLYSASPRMSAVGSTMTLIGSGFTSNNTVLMDGLVAARNVAASSGSLSFTVASSLAPNCAPGMACPMFLREVTPGQYSITVQNANGTSNAINFTVAGTLLQPSSY